MCLFLFSSTIEYMRKGLLSVEKPTINSVISRKEKTVYCCIATINIRSCRPHSFFFAPFVYPLQEEGRDKLVLGDRLDGRIDFLLLYRSGKRFCKPCLLLDWYIRADFCDHSRQREISRLN